MRFLTVFILLNLLITLTFQNCAKNNAVHFEKVNVTALSTGEPSPVPTPGTTQPPTTPPPQYKTCTLPSGAVVDTFTLAWGLKNLSTDGTTCDLFEFRQCLDGTMNPASPEFNYNNSGCLVPGLPVSLEPKANCTIDGKTINHREVTIAFRSKLVSGTNNCIGQIRRCDNGVLSGSSDYSTLTCGETFIAPTETKPIDCALNGITIPDGSAMIAFENPVPTGDCKFELRRCLAGKLSGSYLSSFCTPKPPQ